MFSFFNRNQEEVILVNELDSLIGTINLIDIREPYELTEGYIRTAKNIPMGILVAQPNQYLNKNEKYYVVCQSGMRSSRTVNTLRRAGYQVINVVGGMGSYTGRHRTK